MNKITATEKRILDVLSDGMPHTKAELFAVMDDDMARVEALQNHMSRLRKKLPPGQAIICEYIRHTYQYRQVRLIGSANDGRK